VIALKICVLAAIFAIFLGATGCSQVLDIEQAHVDPALDGGAGSASAGSTNSAQMTSNLDDTGGASGSGDPDAGPDADADADADAL
jgi:hypothetical protein